MIRSGKRNGRIHSVILKWRGAKWKSSKKENLAKIFG
jgi:hypothetical protein